MVTALWVRTPWMFPTRRGGRLVFAYFQPNQREGFEQMSLGIGVLFDCGPNIASYRIITQPFFENLVGIGNRPGDSATCANQMS